jgi:hypothetical protein
LHLGIERSLPLSGAIIVPEPGAGTQIHDVLVTNRSFYVEAVHASSPGSLAVLLLILE